MTNIVTWLTTYAAHVDGHHRDQLLAAADAIEALRAQVAELHKDAERYRWLRDEAPRDIGDMASVRDHISAADIDAAIDAAMPTVAPSPLPQGAVTGHTSAG